MSSQKKVLRKKFCICINFQIHPTTKTNFIWFSFFWVWEFHRPLPILNDCLYVGHTRWPKMKKSNISKNNKQLHTKLHKHVCKNSPDICVNFQIHPTTKTNFIWFSFFWVWEFHRPLQILHDFLYVGHTRWPTMKKSYISKNNKPLRTKLYKYVCKSSSDICVNFQIHPTTKTNFIWFSFFLWFWVILVIFLWFWVILDHFGKI